VQITGTWDTLLAEQGCSREVRAHCAAVAGLAQEYTSSPLVDRGLVEAGSVLHDIGRSRTHGAGHAQAGAAICRRLGLDRRICSIVERHIGGGLTADECSLLGLVPRDSLPVAIEERIVAHADNLVRRSDRQCIERLLWNSTYLPRRIRRRIYRLGMQVELFRE
jgi:uncharacterized protein